MTQFKGFMWRNCAWVFTLLVATSCVKADKHNELYENKPGKPTRFRMSKSEPVVDVSGFADNLLVSNNIQAETSDASVISKEANYTSRRIYNLSMCGIQDIRANNSVLGLKMDVYSEIDVQGKDGSRTLVVERDGCVYWRVTLPFNYFADSVNLEVNFVFKTTTGMKAYIHRKMLFNPWDNRRGLNPETLDFTNRGLSEEVIRMPWARGIDEIDLALAGKLIQTEKRLEIGSVNIVPVQKNNQNFVTDKSQSEKETYIQTNLIGNILSTEFDSKGANEALRLNLNGGKVLQTLDLHLNVLLDNLKIRLKDTAGVNHDEQLTTGRYKIFAQLIATDLSGKGHYVLTDRLVLPDDRVWKTNTMGVNAVIPISLVIRPQWGNLNLALKVVPVDVPGIAPFEGLYHLGRFNELAGGKSPLFDLSEYSLNRENGNISFDYDKYIQGSRNYKEWQKGLAEQGFKICADLTKQEKEAKVPCVTDMEKGYRRFMFSTLNVLFSRIMPGDTATDRTIQYTVETCVIDTLTGARPGAGLVFDIETEDRGHKFVIRRETNDVGCLTWVGMISHKFYHRENLVHKVSKLTYMGDDSDKPTFEVDYYINPWDEKFTFGRDSRVLPKEYLQQIAEQQKIAPPTRVLITEFNYDATGFRYSIDKYMNMTVKKTVLMNLRPKILKYNSIVWGRSGMSELRDGIYLLKIAMHKDYLDPAAPGRQIIYNERTGQYRVKTDERTIEKKQYLVVKELLVRVLGGQIVTPIEFDVTDLRTLRIRSQMIIQIETIDESLLRAVALADSKLIGKLESAASQTILKIMNLRAEGDEINKQLEELNNTANLAQVREKLERDKNINVENIRRLLADLDEEELIKTLAMIDRVRGTGETEVSSARNMKYQALNSLLKNLRAKLRSEGAKHEAEVRAKFVDQQVVECRKIMNRLINQGRDEEAALFDPTKEGVNGAPGSLCQKEIAPDQIFFHLTMSNDIGSESWLKALLTPDEFELMLSNQLRDDFTKPYLPNYNFNLLSNEGDELINDDGTPRDKENNEVSGLPRRTFIGPITFVLNGNGSLVRPTDVLDEVSCNGTCEQLGEVETEIARNSEVVGQIIRRFGLPVNSSYENNPYFGYVGHFYKKQVNDLIAMQRALRFQYHQEMRAFSKVGNFLEQLSLNFVSFADKPEAVKTLDYNCFTLWKARNEEVYQKWQTGEDKSFAASPIPDDCFKKSDRVTTVPQFFNKMQKRGYIYPPNLGKKLSIPQWREFSKNGIHSRSLSLKDKSNALHAMCIALRSNFANPNNKKDLAEVVKRYQENANWLLKKLQSQDGIAQAYLMEIDRIEDNCHSLVKTYISDVKDLMSEKKISEIDALVAKARQLPFVLERRVRIFDTTNRYIYKNGQTLNYSVGVGFSLSNGFNVNRGYKLDPVEAAEKTLGLFPGATKVASQVIGAASAMLNFQWGMNESEATSNGTSVSIGTTLAAQISTLDIEIKKWEKCLVVRFGDQFLRDNVIGNKTLILLGLGYMMCSGDADTEDDLNPGKPLRVREKYYYLTQIFNDGDMQDPGALSNHPWMLQLRGVRDFSVFEKALKLPSKQLHWGDAWGYGWSDAMSLMQGMNDIKHNDRSSMEVANPEDTAQALKMMSEAFERALPTFPGMYTFSETEDDVVTQWPEE